MFRVLAYRHSGNLGDAVQTVALCRLLGAPCTAVYRDEPYSAAASDHPLVINGWLGGHVPAEPSPTVFAGIHVGFKEEQHIDWIRRNGSPVGARDPFTHDLLTGSGIESALVGCATLTFPRYDGPRDGQFSIDVQPRPGTTYLTNVIGALTWSEQWQLAVNRLDTLRTAERVYTNRLHVILPCLAFGTPVVFPLSELTHVQNKHRLSLLGALGFRYGVETTLDATPWARKYQRSLERALGRTQTPTDRPEFPPAAPPTHLDAESEAIQRRAVRSEAPSIINWPWLSRPFARADEHEDGDAPADRWNLKWKTTVVLRVVRGEPVDAVSREVQVPLHDIETWQRQFLEAGVVGLTRGRSNGAGTEA